MKTLKAVAVLALSGLILTGCGYEIAKKDTINGVVDQIVGFADKAYATVCSTATSQNLDAIKAAAATIKR